MKSGVPTSYVVNELKTEKVVEVKVLQLGFINPLSYNQKELHVILLQINLNYLNPEPERLKSLVITQKKLERSKLVLMSNFPPLGIGIPKVMNKVYTPD